MPKKNQGGELRIQKSHWYSMPWKYRGFKVSPQIWWGTKGKNLPPQAMNSHALFNPRLSTGTYRGVLNLHLEAPRLSCYHKASCKVGVYNHHLYHSVARGKFLNNYLSMLQRHPTPDFSSIIQPQTDVPRGRNTARFQLEAARDTARLLSPLPGASCLESTHCEIRAVM